MNWRAVGSALLLAAMAAWAAWIVMHARTKADYVVDRVARAVPVPACEWMPLDAPSIASLGFSQDQGHAWSDRARAYLAFRVGALPAGAWLDLDVAAVAKGQTLVEVGSQPGLAIRKGGAVRVPVAAASQPQVLLVEFTTEDLLPPGETDRRWLGVAISRLRLCPR